MDKKLPGKKGKTGAADSEDENSIITPLEADLLNKAGSSVEEQRTAAATLDNRDEEGELLNENSSGDTATGDELDVPGSEEDDENESIGEEDEENNSYSLGGEKKD